MKANAFKSPRIYLWFPILNDKLSLWFLQGRPGQRHARKQCARAVLFAKRYASKALPLDYNLHKGSDIIGFAVSVGDALDVQFHQW